jgi:hypothetical protein
MISLKMHKTHSAPLLFSQEPALKFKKFVYIDLYLLDLCQIYITFISIYIYIYIYI